MTCHERWLCRGEETCRVFFVDLEEARLAKLDRLLAFAPAPKTAPKTIFIIRSEGEGFEFTRRPDTPGKIHTASSVVALAGKLCELSGWPLFRLEVLRREKRALLLQGEDAPALAAGLAQRGWERIAGSVTTEATAPKPSLMLLGPEEESLADAVLVRAISRDRLPTGASIVPMEAEDATAALGATALARGDSKTRPALCEHAVRLLYRNRESALVAIEDLGLGAATPFARAPASPTQTTLATIAIGAIGVRVLATGLAQAEHEQLAYFLAGFHEAKLSSPIFAALEVSPAGYRSVWSFGPRHLARSDEPCFKRLLRTLDAFVQHVELHHDPTHVIFLGSAVAKDGALIWLSGEANSGKSTLAMTLMAAHGYTNFADDLVAWHPHKQHARAFPKAVRLRPAAYDFMTELLEKGIRVPPTEDALGVWIINPAVEWQRESPETLASGLFVATRFDQELAAPYELTKLDAGKLRAAAQEQLQTGESEEEMQAAVAAISERFCGLRLVFRDRFAAAAALAATAAEVKRKTTC